MKKITFRLYHRYDKYHHYDPYRNYEKLFCHYDQYLCYKKDNLKNLSFHKYSIVTNIVIMTNIVTLINIAIIKKLHLNFSSHKYTIIKETSSL